jgi:acyl-CoA thioesterase-1
LIDGRLSLPARHLTSFAVAALLVACSGPLVSPSPTPTPSASVPAGPLRYVALGDSYTIGTATVREGERWPDQLVAALGATPPTLELVGNLAVNGFTSREVIEVELPQLDDLRPAFATVLIGVNDVVQGVRAAGYRANVTQILEELLRRLPADRIVAVATPDYTVTPQGSAYGDPTEQAAGIRANNTILREVASARGIAFVDIHDLSLRAATDRTLVAADGLHPSGRQYALWVERIAPVVGTLLGR